MGGDDPTNKRDMTSDRAESPARGERPKKAADGWNLKATQEQTRKSTIDGGDIFTDSEAARKAARSEYRRLSPGARRLFDDAVNKTFWKQNPEFDPEKTGTDGRIDMKNPDHKPYREKYLNIRDDLMLSTGREHWEKVDTAAAVEAVVRQRQAVFGSPGTLDKERLQPRSERTDAVPPTAERQDKRVERPDSVDGVSATARRRGRIWPEAQAMTGKQFKDHVITETTIYGSSKDAAFRIAGKLTDADLDSGAMRTTEGLAGLRALNSAMNPEGISSALTGLSAAEMKEKVRIATAAAKIENELYPRISHRKGLEAFSKNFPRYAEELRKGIEKQKGYKVERIYHRPFKGDSKEMRATITVSREISDRHGEVHTIRTREDVCLGGVDLTRKGKLISAAEVESHGTAESSAVQADDLLLVPAVAMATGKFLMKGALKGVGRLASTEGISSAATIGRELGEEALERSARGIDALAPTRRIARIKAKESAPTQRMVKIENSESPVDALSRTRRMEPQAAFNDAATTQRMERLAKPAAEGPDTIPDVPRTWEPPLKGADTIPDQPAIPRGRPSTPEVRTPTTESMLRRPPGGRPPIEPPTPGDTPPMNMQQIHQRYLNYGFRREEFEAFEDTLRAQGLPEQQVARQMQNRADLLDYYRREWCGNDVNTAREYVYGSDGSIKQAIASDHYIRSATEWSRTHQNYLRTHMKPPQHLRRRWVEKSERFAQRTKDAYMNRP